MRALAKVVLGCTAAAAVAAPVHALPTKAKHACRLLKISEIEKQFGPDVAEPTGAPGPACTWAIGTEPGSTGSGTVATLLLRTQAKVAFEAGRDTDSRSTAIDGLGRDAFYSPATGRVWVMKSSKTVFYVQAVIVGEPFGRDESAGPDLEDKLVRLATKARKRA